MNKLREIMEQEARRRGVIPFSRFMELALYCPNIGYYERADVSPGRAGDFFTSVSVGGLLGELLAFQFADWLALLPAGPRQLVEAGTHDGRLAGDILRWLRQHRPELWPALEYWILESSAVACRRQEITLADFAGKVRWFDSWAAVPPAGVQGVIFSNELLDAMPVHRLGWDATRGQWFEWGVDLRAGDFAWKRLPQAADAALLKLLPVLPPELLAILPDGFITEVCPAATRWWSAAAGSLRHGKLMAIDYGLDAEEFFQPERRSGTLRAFHRHHLCADLLARPGEQDLTAHVNFTALEQAGVSAGLLTDGSQTQTQFLTSILTQIQSGPQRFGEWTGPHTRQFQTLTHPEHLGRAFRVLVQSRYAG